MRIRFLVLTILLMCGLAQAQDSQSVARRIKVVATLPSTCLSTTAAKDVVIKTGASPGLYYCAANQVSWTQDSGGGGTGTVTTVSVATANGFSGTVANATTTPAITIIAGAITPTTVNKVTITAPATGSTLTLVDGKTFTVSNTITLAGTDAQTYTFPTTTATIARTDAGQTFTGVNVFTSPKIITGINDTNGNSLIALTATGSSIFGATLANAASGGTVAWGVTAPTVAASGIAGTPVSFSASDAVAGSSNAGAVAGGANTIKAGNAARLTSGNAAGGAIVLQTGTGIGTGAAGAVTVTNGTVNITNGGTSSIPSLTMGGTTTGFFIPQASDVAITLGGTVLAAFNANGATELNLASNATLGFGSNANASSVNSDTKFTRTGVGVFGVTNTITPVTVGAGDLGAAAVGWRQLFIDQTVTSIGTTGNQTINKAAGTVNIAAAGTTVTVTDSLCTASSLVFAVIRTNDSTATIKNVVPGSGSFVITLTAGATGTVSIGFLVLNQ